MSESPVPDHYESRSARLSAVARGQHHNVDTNGLGDDSYWLERHHTYRHHALEWTGPLAFARAHGAVPGIDHDFGVGWGANGDLRVRLRIEDGADVGLLYVYDRTWDEYAVLGNDISQAAIEATVAHALPLSQDTSAAHFMTPLPNLTSARPVSGPEP